MPHLTPDDCERYVLHHLRGEDLARHEEHLLFCEECQELQAEADEFVRAMKQALSDQSKL
jgi:hypothetical protein